MSEEIKQRMSIEGAERAEQQLKDVAGAQGHVAKTTSKAGDEAAQAAPKIDSVSKAHSGLGAAIKGSLQSWVSWTVVITTVLTLIKSLIATSIEAAKAVADLGEKLNGLAVNQGGKVADQTIKDINKIALKHDLGTTGRNELVGAASTITDLTPDISRKALSDELDSIGRLRKITGPEAGSGSDMAALLQTAMAKGHLSPEAAADQVGTLLTSGFDQKNLGDLYRRGGPEFIAAVYGARDKGLDMRRSASAIPQIMSALDRRDTDGNLNPDLQAAGVTSDMSMVQRLQTIQQATATGKLKSSEAINLMGGYQSADVTGPLLQAVTPDALTKAQGEIQGTTLADLEKLRAQSKYVQAADRAANRDLREKLALENSALAPGGEGWAEWKTKMAEEGGGNAYVGFAKHSMVMNFDWNEMAQPLKYNAPPQTVNHNTNIGQQYNLGTDGQSPLTRPAQGGLR